jgi:dihydroorotase-like cyclic amidohydrolase
MALSSQSKHITPDWFKMSDGTVNDSGNSGRLEFSPTKTFTITDITLFTGTATLPSAYVAVTNGLISSFGPTPSPSSAPTPVISKPGHTLLPGFIDAHMHADKGKILALTQSLLFGVTTVMDMHNEATNVAKLKGFARENVSESADVKMAGCAATIDGGWPMPVVTAHDGSEEVSFDKLIVIAAIGIERTPTPNPF